MRLDDFALPAAPDRPQRLEQLTERDQPAPPPQAVDRTLARPVPSDREGTMPAQLSPTGGDGAVTQLGSTRDSRPAPGLAVSSPTDSKPGGVSRIGGQDRCDPQLTQRFYAECLRILELRSDEFNAPQPASLSAEQRLLAEQRQPTDRLMNSSAAVRLRYATTAQPDADLESNQELAAVYLTGSTPPAPASPEGGEPDKNASLAEVLQDLGIQTVPAGGN